MWKSLVFERITAVFSLARTRMQDCVILYVLRAVPGPPDSPNVPLETFEPIPRESLGVPRASAVFHTSREICASWRELRARRLAAGAFGRIGPPPVVGSRSSPPCEKAAYVRRI